MHQSDRITSTHTSIRIITQLRQIFEIFDVFVCRCKFNINILWKHSHMVVFWFWLFLHFYLIAILKCVRKFDFLVYFGFNVILFIEILFETILFDSVRLIDKSMMMNKFEVLDAFNIFSLVIGNFASFCMCNISCIKKRGRSWKCVTPQQSQTKINIFFLENNNS